MCLGQEPILPRLLCGLLLLALFGGGAAAEKKALVLLGDALTWADVTAAPTPHIDRLVAQGSIAALSCLAVEPKDRRGAYLSLAAGNRAFAPEGWTLTPARSNLATGDFPPKGARFRGMGALALAHEPLRYDIEPGSLGTTLRRAGLKTAAVGAGAELVAVDAEGRVDCRVPSYRFQEAVRCSDLVVADLSSALHPPLRDLDGPRRAARVDEQVGRLTAGRQPEWLIALLSPSPSERDFAELTVCVVLAPGSEPGVLLSGTTRRAGLVTTLDLAPTVLQYFGLPAPGGYSGRATRSVPRSTNAPSRLLTFCRRVRAAEEFRYVLLPLYSVALFGSVAVGWVLFWRRRAAPRWMWRLVAGFLLALLWVPSAALIMPLLVGAVAGPWRELGVVALLAGAPAALSSWRARDALSATRWAAIATVGALGVDLATGAHLQPYYALGYSVLSGGRYYGLGNEAMAVLVAAALLVVGCQAGATQRARRTELSLLAVSAIAIVLVGHPRLGANAGGTLTVATTLCLALLARRSGRLHWWHLPLAGVVAVAVLAGFVMADRLQGSDAQTHLGRAAGAAQAGGWRVIADIAARKLGMSFRVLTYTAWSIPGVLLGLGVLWAFLTRGSRFRREVRAVAPQFDAVLPAAGLGGVVGALTNDTGVAIPALMWAMVALAALHSLVKTERTAPAAETDA